jgi:hypothetical protein
VSRVIIVGLVLMEAQVTSVEVLAEKILSALVLEGLYSWWLQRRLVYAQVGAGVAAQPRLRIQTIFLQMMMSLGPSRLYWPTFKLS